MKTYIPEAFNITADPKEEHNLIIDENTSEFYENEYGSKLFSWYNCQLKYYEEDYLNNSKINC